MAAFCHMLPGWISAPQVEEADPLTVRSGGPSMTSETERVRRIWEKLAPRYDQNIACFERILFVGGGNGSAPEQPETS